MKTTAEQLRKRGQAGPEDIARLSGMGMAELVRLLDDKQAWMRSAAAIRLAEFTDPAADILLEHLAGEKSLYTRLAVCEALEQGSSGTARKMCAWLGRIGNNQHRELPEKVSAKKSFPLPRDLIARSLGRMDSSVFPCLMEVMDSGDRSRIREVIDAVGYLVFNNPETGTEQNCVRLLAAVDKHTEDPAVLWKVLMCLSVFPCRTARDFLLGYQNADTLMGAEARRSLKCHRERYAFTG